MALSEQEQEVINSAVCTKCSSYDCLGPFEECPAIQTKLKEVRGGEGNQ
jgi:hypothetical protein